MFGQWVNGWKLCRHAKQVPGTLRKFMPVGDVAVFFFLCAVSSLSASQPSCYLILAGVQVPIDQTVHRHVVHVCLRGHLPVCCGWTLNMMTAFVPSNRLVLPVLVCFLEQGLDDCDLKWIKRLCQTLSCAMTLYTGHQGPVLRLPYRSDSYNITLAECGFSSWAHLHDSCFITLHVDVPMRYSTHASPMACRHRSCFLDPE